MRDGFTNERDETSVGPPLNGPFHEVAGTHLTRQLLSAHLADPLASLTRRVYEADPDRETWAGALHSIVASEVDVDRLDYLMRDGQKAGTEFGEIDYERLIDALELHRTEDGFKIAPGIRARSAVETLLVQRTQSYKWITFHPRVVGANLALVRALERFLDVGEVRTALHDENVSIRGQERPLRDLFGPLRPNLNYLVPGRAELALAIRGMPQDDARRDEGTELPAGLVDQMVMEAQDEAMLLDVVREEIQAGVDDASVTESLKRASLVARTLLAESGTAMQPGARSELTRLVTYVRAALFRSKNYIPVWKTVEEFSGIVDSLMEYGLRTVVEDLFEEVLTDPAAAGAAPWLTAERDVVLSLLDRDPIAGVNHIVRTLLAEEKPRQLLTTSLSAHRTSFLNHDGFWEVAFAGFSPIRTGNNLTVLFRGEQQRALLETSPLAKALERVEENRTKLFVYFFINYPHEFPHLDPQQAARERENLSKAFIAAFPTFVRTVWPDLLRLQLAPVP